MEENNDNSRQAALQAKIDAMRAAQQQEEQIKTVLKSLMDSAAYERLMNIRMSNPSLYAKLASYVFSLAQAGKLRGKMNEEQLKMVANALLSQKKEGTITRISK